jgi:hypothetical protein
VDDERVDTGQIVRGWSLSIQTKQAASSSINNIPSNPVVGGSFTPVFTKSEMGKPQSRHCLLLQFVRSTVML